MDIFVCNVNVVLVDEGEMLGMFVFGVILFIIINFVGVEDYVFVVVWEGGKVLLLIMRIDYIFGEGEVDYD